MTGLAVVVGTVDRSAHDRRVIHRLMRYPIFFARLLISSHHGRLIVDMRVFTGLLRVPNIHLPALLVRAYRYFRRIYRQLQVVCANTVTLRIGV
ncbi:hypothetical protein D1872_238190 [compost metagenome]